MKIIGTVILILLSSFNCDNKRLLYQEKLRGVIVERKFPNLVFDSSMNRFSVSHYTPYYTKIFYHDKYVLIQSSYVFHKVDLTGLHPDKWKARIQEEADQLRYYTFIYSNDLNKGLRCDSNDIKKAIHVNKDSMLAKEWIFLSNRDNIFKENFYTLTSSKVSQIGNVIEEYKLKNKKDTSMTGSVVLEFSNKNFEGIEYSLGEEIERRKKMKLIKIVTINDGRQIPPSGTYIERVEIPYEIKKLTISNEKEIIKLFEAAKTALN